MRRLLLAALLLAAVLAPHAQAADSVPAPTLRVTVTSATGQPLAKTAKVRWNVVQPGKLAELYVDNTNLPGTTTTIDTLWTSKPVRIFRNITAVAYSAELQRTGVPSGSATAGYGVRFRQAGKGWSAWRDTATPLPFLTQRFVLGDGIKPVQDEKVRYQFQVRFHVVIGDTNDETHRWVVRANN